ncbi:MAG TPA: phosphate signaling complex protein PhoU [Cyclobacteriaceae bacterium]|nr:phosphate signaling complex protein PhoU [Cyclobacteriaceae bacterium]
MAQVELEIQALKDNLLDMIELVVTQVSKCRKVIKDKDTDLAKEVIADEQKVNAQELAIDKDCENIIALYNPVASDLRFVLAAIKISNDLERIADNAHSLAKFLRKHVKTIDERLLEEFGIVDMLDTCTAMLKDMHKALKNDDTKLARKVFDKDEALNAINKRSIKSAQALLKEYPDNLKVILRLFTIVRNLERIGDLTKNIGEEIVFHIEAQVLKHQK